MPTRTQKLNIFEDNRRRYIVKEEFDGANLDLSRWTVTDTYQTTQLVTNGTFAANITSWTDASDVGASIAWNAGGYMDLIGTAVAAARARQSVITIAGLSYTLTFVDGVGVLGYKIGTAAGGSQIASGNGAVGANSVTFTATTALTWLEFAHTDLATFTLDTVSVLPNQGLVYVLNGNLGFYGGSGAWGNPRVVETGIVVTRAAGLCCEWEVVPGATNVYSLIGIATNPAVQPGNSIGLQYHASTLLYIASNDGETVSLALPLAYPATSALYRIREGSPASSAGARWEMSTDGGATWALCWITPNGATVRQYPVVMSYNAAPTSARLLVYQGAVIGPIVSVASPAVTPATTGGELLTNPGFETGDPPANWNAVNGTLSQVADPRTGSTGSKSMNAAIVVGGYMAYGGAADVAGRWIQTSAWLRNIDATNTYLYMGMSSIVVTDVVWTPIVTTMRQTGLSGIGCRWDVTGAAGKNARIDDVSTMALSLPSLLGATAYDCQSKFGVWTVNATLTPGTQAGFACCLDSISAPHNGIFVYSDGTKVWVDTLKADVWANCINGTSAYVPGAELRLVKIPPNGVAVYNGQVLVGSTSTVDDSGMGKLMAPFSTLATNVLANLSFSGGIGV